MEQQDAAVVKYSALSIFSVIYSILIDHYEASAKNPRYRSSMMLAGKIAKEACSYRLKGSSEPHCRASDTRIALETMSRNKSIHAHDFQDGIVYYELPEYMRKNIDYYKENNYINSGRSSEIHLINSNKSTSDKNVPASFGKTKNRNETAYQKEKKRQDVAAASRKQKHYVYYIQWDNDPSFVKIGYSSSPVGRIAGFLTGNPRKLQILRLEPVTSAQDELARHSKFDKYRHAREWFRYEGALKEYIQSLSVDPAVELWPQLPATSREAIKVEYF